MSKNSIKWRDWNEKAFAAAQERDIPILLSIVSSWCRWCRTMDETSYTDDEVAELVERYFIPIRIDSDKRPDLNLRYNAGGWPTTAFLTPNGKIITGGTYIAPDEMKKLLVTVSNTYTKMRDEVYERLAEREEERREQTQRQYVGDDGLSDMITANVISSIEMKSDGEHGGIGAKQKFPHPEVIDLLLRQYNRAGRDDLLRLATKTLDAMSESRLHDKVEGGFFRYSTERDWNAPNYEKLLEINAGVCGNYVHAFQVTSDIRYKETALGALKYVHAALFDGDNGCFYGSQEADHDYYRGSAKERLEAHVPSVDKTIYANWNAMMVSTLLDAHVAFGDAFFKDNALRALDFLLKTLVGDGGLLFHYYDDAPKLEGLLTDQAYVLKALLDAHQVTMDDAYVAEAERLAINMIEALLDEETGALSDRPPEAEAQGRLSESEKPIRENSVAASALVRLHYLTASNPADSESRFLDVARSILTYFVPFYRRYGFLAAGYATAVETLLNGPLRIDVIGDANDSATQELLSAALDIYDRSKVIRLLDPKADKDELSALGWEKADRATARVCLGETCASPVFNHKELADKARQLFDSVVKTRPESTAAQEQQLPDEEVPPEIVERIGDIYQETTKYYRDAMKGSSLDWENKPATYKDYPAALSKVNLPSPRRTGGLSVWATISHRRSIRRYSDQPLPLRDLGQLLWASQGVTYESGKHAFRAAPSAGALYPIETYVVANNIEDLEMGVYHYDPREHCLEQVASGDFRVDIARAALDQPMAAGAAVVFVWTAVAARSKWKYHQRAYRYIYLDAGHIGGNLSIAAAAMGLGCCAIGALYDEEVNALLNVDGKEETVVYMSAVGRIEAESS